MGGDCAPFSTLSRALAEGFKTQNGAKIEGNGQTLAVLDAGKNNVNCSK
jgi:hypothetical protein